MDIQERLEDVSPIGHDAEGNYLIKNTDYFLLVELAQRTQDLQTKYESPAAQSSRNYQLRRNLYLVDENKKLTAALEDIANINDLEYGLREAKGITYSIIQKPKGWYD